jgi:hypothetical protein
MANQKDSLKIPGFQTYYGLEIDMKSFKKRQPRKARSIEAFVAIVQCKGRAKQDRRAKDARNHQTNLQLLVRERPGHFRNRAHCWLAANPDGLCCGRSALDQDVNGAGLGA